MPTSNRTVGITLVVIGLLILLGQMGVDFFGWLWPILLCVIGGFLLWSWYTRSDDSGKVFSGVLLILLAFFFLFLRNDRVDMIRHWPFFVMAPGISLLVMSRVDRTRRDASVPGWIAIAAALVLYFFTSGLFMGLMGFIFGLIGLVLRLLVPLALVALGGWMLLNHRRREAHEGPSLPEKFEPATEWDDDSTEMDTSVGPIPPVGYDDEEEDAEPQPEGTGAHEEPDTEAPGEPDESEGEEAPYEDENDEEPRA
jgi:hypothetical protein